MNWSEHSIGRAVARQLLSRKCLVLVPNCNWTGNECDILGVTTDLRIIDIEVKISRADLRADLKKDKWWYRWDCDIDGPDPNNRRRREWPRKVWKHYFAMPKEIWTPDLVDRIPAVSGVLLLTQAGRNVFIECRRRSKPNRDCDRLKPEHVVDVARLANLRMWDALQKLGEAWAAK